MKKALFSLLVCLLTVMAVAQGMVDFRNASSIVGWEIPRDRNVKFDTTAALYNPLLVAGDNVSSNYAGVDLSGLRAALYFASGTLADVNWQAVTNLALPFSGSPYATFKQSTSTTAGSWFGGTRTMQGVSGYYPEFVSLMVVVWDSALATDPFSPAAAPGLWGRSTVFSYMTPGPWGYPGNDVFMMQNLESFSIGALFPPELIPEPMAGALAGVGGAVRFFMRRGKKP